MLTLSTDTPGARAARDAEWEEASVGWAADGTAVMVLEEKSANIFRNIDIEDLADYGGGLTRSGVSIGPESALRVGAVFACRRVIAEDVAKMPRQLRQVTIDDDGRQKTRIVWPQVRPSSPTEERMASIARVLSFAPNEWMTPIQFFEWMVGTAVTQRAAYAIPTWVGDRLEELLPLLPGAVSVQQSSDWEVEYLVNGYGDTWRLKPGQIVQLTGPVNQNLLDGYSVSSMAREAIGLAQAIEMSQAKFHKNDHRPSGILTSTEPLTEKLREAIRDQMMRSYGPGGTGGVAVLDKGWDFKTLATTAADAQTLQNRDHQVSDICRFFRVFPQMIGHSGGLQGYGTFEQASANHVGHTLVPWVERLEQALMKGLLRPQDLLEGYRIHVMVDSIDRGTFSDRVKAYESGVKVFMTPNEVREREGLDPIDDPAMNRVQLLANNTGMQQGVGGKPSAAAGTAKPAAETRDRAAQP